MDFPDEIFYNDVNSKHGMDKMLYCDRYDSPLGPLWFTGRDGVLTGLSFAPPSGEIPEGSFDAVRHWLDDYFQGISRETGFPLAPSGTPFQNLIWRLLLDIPYGETRTYGEIASQAAELLGREKMSAQAVGQAAGRNPIAIVIPCHRVVGAGGKLTGYASGVERKQWLLAHEQDRRQ